MDACVRVGSGVIFENHCDMPGGSVKMSGFAGLDGAPGKVVCTFLRLIAERGLSSTAMGFVDLGLGVVMVAEERLGVVDVAGVGISGGVACEGTTGRAAVLAQESSGGKLLVVGDWEGGGRFLVGVAGAPWLPLDAASCACATASCCSSC